MSAAMRSSLIDLMENAVIILSFWPPLERCAPIRTAKWRRISDQNQGYNELGEGGIGKTCGLIL